MNRILFRQKSHRGGQIATLIEGFLDAGAVGYQAPAIEYIYCDETAPLLDSPSAGFEGDEGGLEIEVLD